MAQDIAQNGGASSQDVSNANALNQGVSEVRQTLQEGSDAQAALLAQIAAAITADIIGGSTGGTDNRILISKGTGGRALEASGASADTSGNVNLNGGDLTCDDITCDDIAADDIAAQDGAFSATLTRSGTGVAVISQGFNLLNGTIVESRSSNAATFAIKTRAGADPSASDAVDIVFRNVTAGDGTYSIVSLTGALSLTISSGSTLGTSSASPFRIWLVCFNDGGTARLGAINCLSSVSVYPLAAWDIASSTAEGGAGGADSAQVFYTGTAVSSKAYTILGYLTWESGLTTAGTWDAAPTRIQIKSGATPNPGAIVQSVHTQTGTVATGSTTIPDDNSAPQQGTEGTEFMTRAITPSSTANLLDIKTQAITAPSAGVRIIHAMFQDATADAIATAYAVANTANTADTVGLWHRMKAGTSSSTTFKLKIGPNSAATVTFNGIATSQTMAGLNNSYMHIDEIMA